MMLAPDTPPIHVTSDRQVRNLLEITKTYDVRICVSSRSKVETVSEFREEDDEAGECFEDDDDDLVEDENHDGEEDDGEDDDGEEDDGEEDAGISIVAEADENGEDYSVYGKVEDEDEEDDDMCFEDIKMIEGGRSNGNNIYVNQSFVSKDALLSELRLTAVRFKFSFRIYKSTKTLFVTTCPVCGCQWKRRHCTPKYVGRLFIDRVGIIDGLNPQHITDAMKNMFGMTLDYTTSYISLLYAQTLVRVEKIPCSHAIGAATSVGLHISTLACPVYSKDFLFAGYSENIYPCAGQQVEERTCFPPEIKRGPGRQKKSRWQSWNDVDDLQVSRPEGCPVSRPRFFLPKDIQVSRPVSSLPEDLHVSHPEGRPVSHPGCSLPEDLQFSRPVFSLPEYLHASRLEGRLVSRPRFFLPEDLHVSRPEGRRVSRPGFFLPEDLKVSCPVFSLPEDLQVSRPEDLQLQVTAK
ncbi:hypothetical protein IGI04_019322 [Brassica rapa subsp. trilocularis]|uniref:Transposase MuDR plant domain-containing protein n=1 Tax=Brassica rapa subsp. trilocularis TaxID=1813537 RepID=A0ABQ7MFA0_BRACM|nr:hypothetical protein IGI04_019246 [Brassica rapa subsp. trilocularis]KAG5397508.1 hypothetical protein IGI04_019322 [Brassica rapa subsp. trilocularis]